MRQVLLYTIIVIFIGFNIFSCQNKIIASKYHLFENRTWHKDSIIEYKYTAEDSIEGEVILDISIQNTEYPFSNLFVFVQNSQDSIQDTLEFNLFNHRGIPLGKGFGDTKSHLLQLKENLTLKKNQELKFKVIQAMRDEKLDGMVKLGFIFRKKEND